MSAPRTAGPAGPDPVARLGVLGIPLTILLAIQFLLGMTLNLFVALPSGGGAGSILVSDPVLLLHLGVGILLLGLAGRALAMALPLHRPRLVAVTALGLTSVVVAFLSGLSFMSGGQSAGASFVMSAGFAGAFLAAALLLFYGRESPAVFAERDRPTASPEGG
jgi:hypothetical protein